MPEPRTIDLRKASLIEFRSFFFSADCREISRASSWTKDPCPILLYSPAHHALRFTELFKTSAELHDQWDDQTLENGFWEMFGPTLDGNLRQLIWDTPISLQEKDTLIRSMYFIYRDFFALNPLSFSCEMWWDALAYAFNPLRSANPDGNPEHKAIQQAMFETLCAILEIDSYECQMAALHGLNHVAHPETEKAIQAYLKRHPNLDPGSTEYALTCAKGEAS